MGEGGGADDILPGDMGDAVDLRLLYRRLFADKDVVRLDIGVALFIGSERSAAYERGVNSDVQPFREGDFSLCRVRAQAAERLLQYPPCAEHVVVGGQGVVPAPDQVGERARHGLPHIVLDGGDVVVDGRHRPGTRGVADFQIHLRGKIHLPRDFGNAAASKPGVRKIFVTFEPHPSPHIEVDGMLLDIDMVGRRLVAAHVDGVLLVILVNGLLEFLFGQRIVFVRHADIPQDILVAGLGRQGVVGKLRVVVIGPDGDDLELPGVAVVVDLEVIGAVGFFSEPGQFRTFLKGYPFDLPGQFVIVRVEIEAFVLEIPDCKGVALLILRLFLPYAAHRADTLGVNAGESLGFVVVPYAVLVDVHIDVFHAAGQLQPGVAVFLRVNVAGTAHRVEPGVELGVVGHVAAQREQPLAVGQRHLLALLAAADIDGLPLDPPFGAVSDLLGHLFERLVAIFSEIVDDDVVGAFHRAHLPVAATHAVVDTFHD